MPPVQQPRLADSQPAARQDQPSPDARPATATPDFSSFAARTASSREYDLSLDPEVLSQVSLEKCDQHGSLLHRLARPVLVRCLRTAHQALRKDQALVVVACDGNQCRMSLAMSSAPRSKGRSGSHGGRRWATAVMPVNPPAKPSQTRYNVTAVTADQYTEQRRTRNQQATLRAIRAMPGPGVPSTHQFGQVIGPLLARMIVTCKVPDVAAERMRTKAREAALLVDALCNSPSTRAHRAVHDRSGSGPLRAASRPSCTQASIGRKSRSTE